MKWHKIVFNKEQLSAGKLTEFQKECVELYLSQARQVMHQVSSLTLLRKYLRGFRR